MSGAQPPTFKVGSAPWETGPNATPPTFKVGSAPWEIQPQQEPGSFSDTLGNIGRSAVETIGGVGRAIDSVTGAPTRAAIYAAENGQNPFSAAWNQLGDSDTAPTGKQIVQKLGVSDEKPLFKTTLGHIASSLPGPLGMAGKFVTAAAPGTMKAPIAPTAADVAGFGVDVAADPLNFVPAVDAAKGVLKLGGKTALKTAEVAGDLAKPIVKEIPGAKTVGTAVEVMKEGGKQSAQAVKTMFNPEVAKDYPEMVRIAEKNNIPPELLPESVKYGPDSIISRRARTRAEGPLGEPYVQKFNEAHEAVQNATTKKIAEIAGGTVPSQIEAGQVIRDGFDKGVENFFNDVGVTHNYVIDAAPGLTLEKGAQASIDSKLIGLEKWAKGRAERGFTDTQRGQGQQLLRAIDAVRAGNGSYKQTYEALRDIGEVAFKSKNALADIPPDIEKFRDLYFTIDNALTDTAEKYLGKNVANQLRESNNAISEFLGDKSVVAPIIGNKNIGPEKVFSAVVENGDSRKIEALRKILPPDAFNQLKGSFLASQIKADADGAFTFKSLQNNLRNKKNILASLLSPHEAKDLGEIVQLGNRFGNKYLSSSQTSASLLLNDLTKGIRGGLENDALIGVLKDRADKKAIEQGLLPAGPSESGAKPPALPPGPTPEGLAAPIEPNVPSPQPQLSTGGPEKRIIRTGMITPAIARGIGIQTNPNAPKEPTKGPEKWMSDGVTKLQTHVPGGLSDVDVKQLKESKTGQQLLIQASDLEPGTKAMEKVLSQIKAELKKGNK